MSVWESVEALWPAKAVTRRRFSGGAWNLACTGDLGSDGIICGK